MGYYTDEGDDTDDENQTTRTYEVHQRTFCTDFEEDWSEIMGEVEIPEDAIGVHTVTSDNAPPIVDVSWLEPK